MSDGLRWHECRSGTGVQGPVPDSVPNGYLQLPSGAEVFLWERPDGYLVRESGMILGHIRDLCRVGEQNNRPVYRIPLGVFYEIPFANQDDAPFGRRILRHDEEGITYLEDGSLLRTEEIAVFYSHVREYFAPVELVREFAAAS